MKPPLQVRQPGDDEPRAMGAQESEPFVRRVLDNLIAFVGVLAPDGTLLEVNQAPLDLAEIDSSDVVGKKFWDCYWWGYAPDVQARLRDVVERAGAGETARFDVQGRIAGSALLWIDLQLSPMRDDVGNITHLIASAIDITDRKGFEDALHQADRRKDEFLAVLAHELRNPLAPIRTAARILEEPGIDADTLRSSQRIITRQVEHMARLLDDLLDVSRISHGALELRREQCELADLVAAAVETARPLLAAKGHRLDVSLPAAPLGLDVDPVRMTQVIANLLTNASKYTEPKGNIAVQAESDGDGIVIRVCDDGIGLEPGARAGLFTMFFQIERARDRSDGLGVGLSLVRGLVELHGGSVDADSAGPGHGSTFTVRLPGSCLCATPIRPEPAVPARTPSQRVRVLIVDDNRDAAETLATLLAMTGHDAQAVFSGDEALTHAEQSTPDVMILDIGMPGMNGYELALRIRERPWGERTTLIALTGWGQQEDRQRAEAAGFDHHLTKPVAIAALQALLEGVRAGQA